MSFSVGFASGGGAGLMRVGSGRGSAGRRSTCRRASRSRRPVPGEPQRLNSLPMSMAVSPDGRWVVTVNAGYGTWESGYMQSLAVVDTRTGAVADLPDDADTGGGGADAVLGAGVQRGRTASVWDDCEPDGPGGEEGRRYGERDRGVRVCGREADAGAGDEDSAAAVGRGAANEAGWRM